MNEVADFPRSVQQSQGIETVAHVHTPGSRTFLIACAFPVRPVIERREMSAPIAASIQLLREPPCRLRRRLREKLQNLW